jgi:hypothetical protein
MDEQHRRRQASPQSGETTPEQSIVAKTDRGRKENFGCAILKPRSCLKHVSSSTEYGCGCYL